jgi:hypothetical protein
VSTRLDLKPGLIAELKAQLTVAVIAASIAETSAIVLSLAVDLGAGAVPPTALVLYGAATVLLGYRWVLSDAQRAFDAAVQQRHVVLDGYPASIMSIRPTFRGRWLARLPIRLHPNLATRRRRNAACTACRCRMSKAGLLRLGPTVFKPTHRRHDTADQKPVAVEQLLILLSQLT